MDNFKMAKTAVVYFSLLLLLLVTPRICESFFAKNKISNQSSTTKILEIDAVVTAYCPCEKCCGKWADGFTACNHKIQKGDKFVSAPPEYPFFTLIYIPGYHSEPVPVLDRGGAIKGNKFDVFYDDHDTALRWGIKKMVIYTKAKCDQYASKYFEEQ